MEHGEDSMRILRELDETTEWELPRELQSVEDKDDNDSLARMRGNLSTLEEGPEEVTNILDCISGMEEKKEVQDILSIVNMKNDDQLLLTNVGRNDQIMGMLIIAMLNWYRTEIDSEYEQEGGE